MYIYKVTVIDTPSGLPLMDFISEPCGNTIEAILNALQVIDQESFCTEEQRDIRIIAKQIEDKTTIPPFPWNKIN